LFGKERPIEENRITNKEVITFEFRSAAVFVISSN